MDGMAIAELQPRYLNVDRPRHRVGGIGGQVIKNSNGTLKSVFLCSAKADPKAVIEGAGITSHRDPARRWRALSQGDLFT